MSERKSGILMHISSLPSIYPIGDFGPAARRFADFLQKAGQKIWQVLPLTATDPGRGNSPYSSISAFAINPLFISPEILAADGLITQEELSIYATSEKGTVNYDQAISGKDQLLRLASRRFAQKADLMEKLAAFEEEESYWLSDMAIYTVIRQVLKIYEWPKWPEELKLRTNLATFAKEHEEEILHQKICQYFAYSQWKDLLNYCHEKGLEVLGDIPIYVDHDSSDVWSHPELFKLDSEYKVAAAAGVPPDYFSATGQLWGNPCYNWPKIAETGFDWWVRRLEHNQAMFDYIRIDHFRGLAAYWEVPAGEKTAINGKWVPGPGAALFRAAEERLGKLNIVAEDLGTITPDVISLINELGFPGMKVLQFAFSDPQNLYMPHNFERNTVVYTGTHDNNTTVGWYKTDASDKERGYLAAYTGKKITSDNVAWELLRLAEASVANTAIIAMQDALSLDGWARMNTPGVAANNFAWRMVENQLSDKLATELLTLTQLFNR